MARCFPDTGVAYFVSGTYWTNCGILHREFQGSTICYASGYWHVDINDPHHSSESTHWWVSHEKPQFLHCRLIRVLSYALMAFCNIVILFALTRWEKFGSSAWSRFRPRKKSTGLKWDPVSLADFVSLFAGVNALKCFETLELDHQRAAQGAMDERMRFRLGYWRKYSQDGPVVYGIGTVGHSHGVYPIDAVLHSSQKY